MNNVTKPSSHGCYEPYTMTDICWQIYSMTDNMSPSNFGCYLLSWLPHKISKCPKFLALVAARHHPKATPEEVAPNTGAVVSQAT